VSLKRVQIDAAKSFVFDVAFPYDPESLQTSHYFNRLYIETIAALGWKNFAFRDAPDQLRIEITGNRAKKSVSVEFVTLQ
jgi:hypothetical protein